MDVYPPDAPARHAALFEQEQGLIMARERSLGKCRQKRKHFVPPAEGAAGRLADDEGMAKNQLLFEQSGQDRLPAPKVLDPHRRGDEYHRAFVRRRRFEPGQRADRC